MKKREDDDEAVGVVLGLTRHCERLLPFVILPFRRVVSDFYPETLKQGTAGVPPQLVAVPICMGSTNTTVLKHDPDRRREPEVY